MNPTKHTWWLLLTLLLATALQAAPLQTSAEVAVNSKVGQLEVVLTLPRAELQRALESHSGGRLPLGGGKRVDKELEKYLWRHFEVRDHRNRRLKIRWQRKQLAAKEVTVHFAIPYGTAPSLWFLNTMLSEVEAENRNQVTIKHRGGIKQLLFGDRATKQQVRL